MTHTKIIKRGKGQGTLHLWIDDKAVYIREQIKRDYVTVELSFQEWDKLVKFVAESSRQQELENINEKTAL